MGQETLYRSPREALPDPENLLVFDDVTASCDDDCKFEKTGIVLVEKAPKHDMNLYWGGILQNCQDHHAMFRLEGDSSQHNSFTLSRGGEMIGHAAISTAAFAGFLVARQERFS